MTIPTAVFGGLIALALAVLAATWRIGSLVGRILRQGEDTAKRLDELEKTTTKVTEDLRGENRCLREDLAEVQVTLARLEERLEYRNRRGQ